MASGFLLSSNTTVCTFTLPLMSPWKPVSSMFLSDMVCKLPDNNVYVQMILCLNWYLVLYVWDKTRQVLTENTAAK